jgi:hypothetical protein
MSGSNLEWVDNFLDPRPPERDVHAHAARQLQFDRHWLSEQKRTWRDRLADIMIDKIVAILARDASVRRRLCVAIAPELRRTNEWLDRPAPPPPAPHKD